MTSRAFAGAWRDVVVAGLPASARTPASVERFPKKSFAGYTGNYEAGSVPWRFPNAPATEVSPAAPERRVRGQGVSSFVGQEERQALLPVARTGSCRFAGQPLATVAFIEHDGALLYLQLGDGNFKRR
ncbi:MAG: hypothetical protein U5K38_06835 [Woeseiaceae bacterium]|nr:hypothetical protein [Woeseiaceae bacterium]